MTEQHKDYVAAVALVCLLAIVAVLVVMAYRHEKCERMAKCADLVAAEIRARIEQPVAQEPKA